MKKVITAILALLIVLALCACSNQNKNTQTENKQEPETTADTNTVELTLDNYSKYLNVYGSAYASQTEDSSSMGTNISFGIPTGNGHIQTFFNNGFELSLRAEGVSTNYDYNDIVITGRFTGTYGNVSIDGKPWGEYDLDEIAVDETLTVELNIAGKGSTAIILPAETYTCTELLNIEFEVIDISGTVTKN